MNKEASSSNDPLSQCVQEAYGRGISQDEVRGFIEGVVSYDGLYEAFLTNPSSVSTEIFASEITGHVCVPCYTLELRQILKNRTLVSSYKVLGFSLEIAKKYLAEYPVLLVIDERKLHEQIQVKLNGARIYDNEFHFGEALIRVLVRDRGDSDTMASVSRIVTDLGQGVEVGVITDAPGLKMAQTAVRPQLKKFIVNVPTLEIDQEVVKSENDVKALQEALTRKWQQSGNPHQDPKYTAEYWLSSPMIQQNPNMRSELVREAETAATYIIKEAVEQPQQSAPELPKQEEQKKQPVKLHLPLNIDPSEQEIFDLLLKVNQQFNLGLTFRVAGGWVRDKALGGKSKDIDIALDKMTGAEFCKYLTQATGRRPQIIAADAAKSKNLETATINLGSAQDTEGNITGTPIDFVNLRKEVYEPGSRVPKMTIGTAEEDAVRRDFTLNALFYNVNTKQVEDLTGRGLHDLANLELRTPLDPKQTFADDPLRVFRALRFLAKFKGSTIEPKTLKAIHDPQVQEALDPRNLIDVEVDVLDKKGNPVIDKATGQPQKKIEKQRKISEERILEEWRKLFRGPQAAEALKIAHDSGLWQKVFIAGAMDFETDVPVPELDDQGNPIIDPKTNEPKKKYVKQKRDLNTWHPFTMDQNNAWHVDTVFDHSMKVVQGYDKILREEAAAEAEAKKQGHQGPFFAADDNERGLALAAAFMHDLGKLDPTIIGTKNVEGILRNTYHGHENSSAAVAEAILRGIKASNEEVQYIRTIVQRHMLPHDTLEDKTLRKMIRSVGRSLFRRIVQHAKADSMSKPGGNPEHYDKMLAKVTTMQADEPDAKGNVKPVVGGEVIMKMFPGLKPQSGFIKEIQDHLQDMKDGDPTMTTWTPEGEIEKMRAGIMAKYQNWAPVPKAKQQQKPTVAPAVQPQQAQPQPPKQAAVVPFNLSKQAGGVEMLCGKVYKHKFGVGSKSEHDAVYLMTDGGEEFRLRLQDGNAFDDPELNKLVGKRICGKGMLHDKHVFILAEYSVVNLDKDEDVVEMKRKVPDDMTSFSVGDKVRHRKRGLAFEQLTGRVDRIDHGLMYIKWDGVKELEVFSLSDPVAIHGILQKL